VASKSAEIEDPSLSGPMDARRLRLLVDALCASAVCMLDPAGRIAFCSAGTARIAGWPSEELVGEDYSLLFTEEDRHGEKPAAALAAARDHGRHEMEGWRRRRDATRFWAHSVLEAVREQGGELVGFAEITHDLTKRRAVEEARLESERRFRILVDGVTDYAICMLDPGGVVLSWNRGAEQLEGYRANEIVGRHFSILYTEEERHSGEPERALRMAVRDGKVEREAWRVRKDGSRLWANVVIDAIRNSDGDLIGFAKVTRDATERRRALNSLEASERQFRLLVDGVTDYAIFMLDPNGVVSNWNIGAKRIKGYAAAEIVGQHFSRFYTDEDREAGIPAAALELARREGRYESEGWRVRKDGTRFWASVVVDAIREDGRLVGFAKITRDITERRAHQAALETAREQLAQSQKMEAIGQLTGGIAHDFNNLLMVMVGRLDLLRRKVGNAGTAVDLDAIERAVERGQSLTRQLLAFSRRQALLPSVIDLREWLPGTLEMLRPSLRGDIRIVTQVGADVWPIEVDPNEFELALINIAVNARDAMPHGGTLTITATNEERRGGAGGLEGEFVRLSLADTGEGIAPELLDHVFEPFFTTKEVGKGTGLGLSQVYGFATQTGGSVSVGSRVGEGTTVILTLPRAVRPATPLLPPENAGGDEHGAARILLVEDNAEVAEVTAVMLRSLGHEVAHVAQAQAALDRIAAGETFDLVVSDVVMPGDMNGIELARALRGRADAPQVLLVTGYSSATRQASEEGLTILMKPFQLRALDLAIRDSLRRRAGLRLVKS
jgi:PAS domain S-box-containing protein